MGTTRKNQILEEKAYHRRKIDELDLELLSIIFSEQETTTPPPEDDDDQDSERTKRTYYNIFSPDNYQVAEEIPLGEILRAVLEFEAGRYRYSELFDRWSRQIVKIPGYGLLLDDFQIKAIPTTMHRKYRPVFQSTRDGVKFYALKAWAIVRDRATNTPGNFQELLPVLKERGYRLDPEPTIPPVLK